jgi:hypothetical protein
VERLAEDGSVGSVYDVTTGKFLTPDEAGKIDFATITQVNAKGESITNILFGKEEFDQNIQYIAKNVQWKNGDRNELGHAFAHDPELEKFLEQFKGMPGYKADKLWTVTDLPMSFSNDTNFFILYIEKRGDKTLMVFKDKVGNFEAVYSDLDVYELLGKTDDPVVQNLHP